MWSFLFHFHNRFFLRLHPSSLVHRPSSLVRSFSFPRSFVRSFASPPVVIFFGLLPPLTPSVGNLWRDLWDTYLHPTALWQLRAAHLHLFHRVSHPLIPAGISALSEARDHHSTASRSHQSWSGYSPADWSRFLRKPSQLGHTTRPT